VTAAIPSPSSGGLQLGPFDVHVYGLLYVVGLAVAVLITVRRWEAQGGSRSTVYDVAMWGFPAGVIGGRLYFDLTSSGEVPAHWWGPFAVWDGGMGIWGGIALGTLVGIWRLRRGGVSVAAFMDAAAPALLVGQAIGRIGNYFNQELFGGPTSLPWALEISPAHRPAGYGSFTTFQPTFLYELIWNLTLAAFLVWFGKNRRIRPPGLFALYVTGYSGFRIFEELLRVDPAHHIFGLRLNFYVAMLLCVAGLVWFAYIQGWRPTWRQSRRGAALLLAGGMVALSGCGGTGRADASPATLRCQQPSASSRCRPAPLQRRASRGRMGRASFSPSSASAISLLRALPSKPSSHDPAGPAS
jgi:prolipoprotein diacylglyceryl transferase